MTLRISDLKRIAKRDGLEWSAVCAAADQYLAQETESASRDHGIRKAVYQAYCHPAKRHLPFWRAIGQWNNPAFNGAFGGGNDYTVIPRWDDVASEIAGQFPELQQNDAVSENLYQLILREPARIPNRREALEHALSQLLGEAIVDAVDRQTEVPF